MKKIKLIKRHAIGGIVSGAGNLLATGIGSTIGTSSAATESEAKSQTTSNMLSGASSGASIGMAAGPIGAAVGAVVGAIPGIIGKKGKVTPNGFFEDPSITYGTGLFRSNSGLKKEYNAAKQRVAGNRIAQGQGEDLSQLFEENYDTDVMSMAYGGYSPNLAYLDDGEILQTPDGKVKQVPEQGLPTDSNLMSLPEGTRILSNTLKVPGTKKTFSELGEQMMIKKKSKGSDRFALNASKLNEMSNKTIHDLLFSILERLKISKGSKAPISKFVGGGEVVMPKLDSQPQKQTFGADPSFYVPTNIGTPSGGENFGKDSSTSTFDWGSAISGGLSTIASIAPALSNINASDSAPAATNYNPYANTIKSKMRNRKFNINPAMEDINRNRNISNYNAGQVNPNTGANMAYRLQTAALSNRDISNLRALESNVNNLYSADYANTLNSLGQQWVGATNMSSDINAQNRAATRNIRRTGMSQLSQTMQNRELMSNQSSRDDAMMSMYAPFLQAGYSKADISNLMGYLKKGGNNVG